MIKPVRWIAIGLRRTSLVLFAVLVFFWTVTLLYCGHAYFTRGATGIRAVLLHGTPISDDPNWLGHPRWDLVAMRYGLVALLTIFFGLTNRRTLAKFLGDFREGVRSRFQSPS